MKLPKLLIIHYRVISFDKLPERFNEALLKKKLTLKENDKVMKKSKIT